MNPREFIRLAEKIVANGPAGARSAVSRAYYGAFHVASEMLTELGCAPPRGGKAHNIVPVFFDFAANNDARRASSLLSDLHSDRILADYRLENDAVEQTRFGQVSVESAHAVVEALDRFRVACHEESVLEAFRSHVVEVKKMYQLP